MNLQLFVVDKLSHITSMPEQSPGADDATKTSSSLPRSTSSSLPPKKSKSVASKLVKEAKLVSKSAATQPLPQHIQVSKTAESPKLRYDAIDVSTKLCSTQHKQPASKDILQVLYVQQFIIILLFSVIS